MGFHFRKTLAVLSASALSMSALASFPSDGFNSIKASAVEAETEMLLVSGTEDLPDSEELFAGYVEQAFYGSDSISMFSVGNRTAGSQLTGDEKLAYDALVPIIRQIAAGERASTDITIEADFTENYLDFDLTEVYLALLVDLPYEMYWQDKTTAASYGRSFYENTNVLAEVRVMLPVVEAYAGAENYTTDTVKTGATTQAVANAKSIVAANVNQNDYQKLLSYRDAICEAVSYNHDAADEENNTPYGDPWQMIYAFDGDPDTNIVCEGYAKAFQYLCDQTAFASDISCYSVTGTMDGGTGAGGHMWNVVTMEDGCNYIVDVTNSDEGSIGQDGGLFLSGLFGSVENGYIATFDETEVTFVYDAETQAIWGTDADSILQLSAEDYTFSYQPAVLNDENVYEISNASQLYWFAELVNGTLNGVKQDTDADAILMNDIVVNQDVLTADGALNGDGSAFTEWVPIGLGTNSIQYLGEFDGNGYTISGLYINDIDLSYAGFIGQLDYYGAIRNLSITDTFILNEGYAGTICASSHGKVFNCHSVANVTGYGWAGGICGNAFGTVANCTSQSTVHGHRCAGGIVGDMSGTLVNSYHVGAVSVDTSYAGGIVGQLSSGSVENCYSVSTVTGTDQIGGICGEVNSNTVTNSYYLADDSYDSTVGTVLTAAQMTADAGTSDSLIDALNTGAETYNEASPEYTAFYWGRLDDVNNGYPVYGGTITYLNHNGTVFTDWAEGFNPVQSYATAQGAVLPTGDDIALEPGYVLTGWYAYDDTTTIVTKIPKGTNGNKVYIAKIDFSCTEHDFECTVTDGVSTRTCTICGETDQITVPTDFKLYWNTDGGTSYSSILSENLCVGSTLKMWVNDVTLDVDNYEMVVELSDPSVAEYTFDRYYNSTNDTMGHFTCLREGTTEIRVYPKYNPELVETATLTVAHTDEDSDGICDSCDEFADNIGVLSGATITLDGTIGLNFFMQLDESVAESETAYMQFTFPDGEITSIPVKDIVPTVMDGVTYYTFRCEMAAARMADQIKAQIFLSPEDEQGGTQYTYSVKQYADYLLANTETNAEYAEAEALVKAMLNYGAYSQTYFTHNTDTLANAGLDAADQALADVTIPDADAAEYTAAGLPEGVHYYGSSLLLLSNTVIRHYFVIEGDDIPAVSDGWSEITKSGSYYYTEMADIAAAELGEKQLLNIGDWSISYSALSYAKTMLGGDDEDLNNVLKALYWYYQAADSYFSANA